MYIRSIYLQTQSLYVTEFAELANLQLACPSYTCISCTYFPYTKRRSRRRSLLRQLQGCNCRRRRGELTPPRAPSDDRTRSDRSGCYDCKGSRPCSHNSVSSSSVGRSSLCVHIGRNPHSDCNGMACGRAGISPAKPSAGGCTPGRSFAVGSAPHKSPLEGGSST